MKTNEEAVLDARRAVGRAVDGAVFLAVSRAVYRAVDGAVNRAVRWALDRETRQGRRILKHAMPFTKP